MIYPNQFKSKNVLSKSLISLSLLSLTSAFVLPSITQLTDNNNPTIINSAESISSIRKSINYGPLIKSNHFSLNKPSLELELFNSAVKIGALQFKGCNNEIEGDEVTKCISKLIGEEFLLSLHPTSHFKLIDAYVTKNTQLTHLHYLQLNSNDGIPIANGNFNLNIAKNGEIVSYGDSSFAGVTKSSTTKDTGDFKKTVASWSKSATQIILGNGKARMDKNVEDLLSEYSSPPLVASTPTYQTDPRHGLVSFLTLQSPSVAFAEILISTSRDEIINTFEVVEHTVDEMTKHSHSILNVPTTLSPVKASLAYVHDGKDLQLTWKYEVHTDDNQYEAYVSASPDSDLIGSEPTLLVVDWVRDFRPTGGEIGFAGSLTGLPIENDFIRPIPSTFAKMVTKDSAKLNVVEGGLKDVKPSYKVFPWGINAPDVGKRELLTGSLIELVPDASPAGWHTIPASFPGGKAHAFIDTRGNNVYAQDNPDGGNSFENNYRPSGGVNLTFDFPLGWPKAGKAMDPAEYIDASVTELFYTNNEIHDLFYTYGFDEVSGNFQDYNFGKGGLGDDAVRANAQDGSGMNNANFATPPDGSRGSMRMYSWSGTQPYRDGDFEAGIVIHEYSHGISTRLTGGPANSGCLGWGEAGGMGEGWGDFFATMIRQHKKSEVQFNMGEWASSRKGGIRTYPYSQNMTINSDTYKSLDKPGYWGVHNIGQVWAEMLFEVAEILIDDHGFHSGLFPPSSTDSSSDFYDERFTHAKVPKYGNTLIVQLVVDGMKLQPCRPSFQDARDAILTADKVLTNGENACSIWKGFSKRGLGPASTVVGSTPWGGGIRSEDYTLPKGCIKKN